MKPKNLLKLEGAEPLSQEAVEALDFIGSPLDAKEKAALDTAVNLYVTLPGRKAFFAAVSGSALLAAHVIVALILLGAATSALVRAIRARRVIVPTAVGLACYMAAVCSLR